MRVDYVSHIRQTTLHDFDCVPVNNLMKFIVFGKMQAKNSKYVILLPRSLVYKTRPISSCKGESRKRNKFFSRDLPPFHNLTWPRMITIMDYIKNYYYNGLSVRFYCQNQTSKSFKIFSELFSSAFNPSVKLE